MTWLYIICIVALVGISLGVLSGVVALLDWIEQRAGVKVAVVAALCLAAMGAAILWNAP